MTAEKQRSSTTKEIYDLQNQLDNETTAKSLPVSTISVSTTYESEQVAEIKGHLNYLTANYKNSIWVHPAIDVFGLPGKGCALQTTQSIGPNVKLVSIKPKALLNINTVKIPSNPKGETKSKNANSVSEPSSEWTSHQLLAYFLASTVYACQPALKEQQSKTQSKSQSGTKSEPQDSDSSLHYSNGVIKMADKSQFLLPTSDTLTKETCPWYNDLTLLHRYLQMVPKNYDNMPICWDIDDVPVELREKVQEQRKVLLNDYKTTCGLLKDGSTTVTDSTQIPFQLYQWAWLTVNTRCLYTQISPHSSQNITLSPVIDLLNHTADNSKACVMKWDILQGMSIHTGPDVSYEPGDEIFITYGHHPNSFLAIEYGFAMDNNAHESLDLGPALPLLCETYKYKQNDNEKNKNEPEDLQSLTDLAEPQSKRQRTDTATQKLTDFLSKIGYLGDYTISDSSSYISFRTVIAAIAIAHQSNPRPAQLVADGAVDETNYEKDVERIIKPALSKRRKQIKQQLEQYETRQDMNPEARSVAKALYKNWLQLLKVVEKNAFCK